MFRMNFTRLCELVAAVVLLGLPVHASVLVPGATNVPPDVFPNPGSPSLLGSLSGTFNYGGGLLTGSWQEFVVVDPLGVTCSGCLDFAFQVMIDSNAPGAIFSMNLSRFFGYTTDVGYITDSGDDAPNSVSRGAGGGLVTFNFNTDTSALIAGESSDLLVVATNATTFDTNGILGISGGGDNQTASGQVNNLFEPTSLAPEPATILLFTLGLAAIAALRKRTNLNCRS